MYIQLNKDHNTKIMIAPLDMVLAFVIYCIHDYFHNYSLKAWVIAAVGFIMFGILQIRVYEYKNGVIFVKLLFVFTAQRISCLDIRKIFYIDGKYRFGAHIKIDYADGTNTSMVVSRSSYKKLIAYFEQHCGVKVKIKVPD